MEPRDRSTDCIHAGEFADAHGAPHTPLYDTTTFRFATTEALLEIVDGHKEGGLYTRYGLNPTLLSLEAKLAAIDQAEASLSFASGMAALSSLFLAHGRKGIAYVSDAYGGTLELLGKQLPGLGFDTRQFFTEELDALEAYLSAGAGLVFFETPTNPLLEIIDIRKLVEIAHRHGALVAVDNTFASSVNQMPLQLGVDIVMQSATKYLGGHSDLTGGVLSSTRELLEPIKPWRKNLGQVMAPETAHRLVKSLSTLYLRVQKQNANALAIAQFLEAHPKVRHVYYPGLPAHPGHAVAQSQMSGFGGMVAFEFEGSGPETQRMVERLRLISLAPSLGGVESLVTQPCTTSHRDMPAAERQKRGITDALVRLSIGIESAEDLMADLAQALAG